MSSTRWIGWYRPNHRAAWIKLAEADSYDDAWGLLLDRLPEGPGGESMVLQADRTPSPGQAGGGAEGHPLPGL